jgi:hypothetical protein
MLLAVNSTQLQARFFFCFGLFPQENDRTQFSPELAPQDKFRSVISQILLQLISRVGRVKLDHQVLHLVDPGRAIPE